MRARGGRPCTLLFARYLVPDPVSTTCTNGSTWKLLQCTERCALKTYSSETRCVIQCGDGCLDVMNDVVMIDRLCWDMMYLLCCGSICVNAMKYSWCTLTAWGMSYIAVGLILIKGECRIQKEGCFSFQLRFRV